MRIDFHSHILPGMDDGASDVEESLEMLEMLADSGVEKVILTSHFYRQKENIGSFIERRQKAYEKLSSAVKDLPDLPELVLGAEVYFYPSLSSDPDFPKLCIGNTGYVLLELPFEQFHDNFYSGYAKFMNNCEQKIVLAHIERYLSFGNTPKDLARLLEYGQAVCQMNCPALAEAGMFKRKPLIDLINSGIIKAIGTDAHNTDSRAPVYDKAEKIIVSKCGKRAFEDICRTSEMILDDCSIRKLK